jgi:hypothetical protein
MYIVYCLILTEVSLIILMVTHKLVMYDGAPIQYQYKDFER